MGIRAETRYTQEVIVLDEKTSAKLGPVVDALAAMLVADLAIGRFLERKGWTGQMLAWNTLLRTLAEGYEPAAPESEALISDHGFMWLGQSWQTCEGCGEPADRHVGLDEPCSEHVFCSCPTSIRPWRTPGGER